MGRPSTRPFAARRRCGSWHSQPWLLCQITRASQPRCLPAPHSLLSCRPRHAGAQLARTNPAPAWRPHSPALPERAVGPGPNQSAYKSRLQSSGGSTVVSLPDGHEGHGCRDQDAGSAALAPVMSTATTAPSRRSAPFSRGPHRSDYCSRDGRRSWSTRSTLVPASSCGSTSSPTPAPGPSESSPWTPATGSPPATRDPASNPRR